MAESNPADLWSYSGETSYRKLHLFSNPNRVDFAPPGSLSAAAPFGGAFAVAYPVSADNVRDEPVVPQVKIYTCAGQHLRTISFTEGSVAGLGWSVTEQLIIVGTDGRGRCYQDILGDFASFRLLEEHEVGTIVSCSFYSTGFVAFGTFPRTPGFIHVDSYDSPKPLPFKPVQPGQIHSWALIPNADRISVLVAIDGLVYLVDKVQCTRRRSGGPFRKIAVSPNGKSVALYSDDGKLILAQVDLMSKQSVEVDVSDANNPIDIRWCGNVAPVLVWRNSIEVVGDSELRIDYTYRTPIALAVEFDGLRIFSGNGCDFIQRVPIVLEEVFGFGSTRPSAMLLTAFSDLGVQSHKSHSRLQMIQRSLDQAVAECIEAAGNEFSPYWQKKLLGAASFGKTVLDFYNSDPFLGMCTKLRILNAVRGQQVGMSLTIDQLEVLTVERLIERLFRRQNFLLASRIAEFMKLPTDKIHVHWAMQKVKEFKDTDDHIYVEIEEHLRDKKAVPFVDIAITAFNQRRTKLATSLLNLEPRISEQVRLLLKMKEDGRALRKALESGNTDLVYHVLAQCRKGLTPHTINDFSKRIQTVASSFRLFEKWAGVNDPSLLKKIYELNNRGVDIANGLMAGCVDDPALGPTIAASLLELKGDRFDFYKQSLTKANELRKMKLRLEVDLQGSLKCDLAGLSVHETVIELVRAGASEKAAAVKSAFEMSKETYEHLVLRALIANQDEKSLIDLAKKRKKTAITWDTYYDQIGTKDLKAAAVWFIHKTGANPEKRTEMYVDCGFPRAQAREAAKLSNLAQVGAMIRRHAST